MNPARYAKAIVAVLSAGLLTAQSLISLSDRTRAWVTVAIAVLTAVTVYLVPNAAGPTADPGPPVPPGKGDRGLPPSEPDTDRNAG